MSEIIPKSRSKVFNVVDELISRRQRLFELIVIITIAAILINFISGILASYVYEHIQGTSCFWILITISSLLVFSVIFSAAKIYVGTIKENIHFEIFLPLKNEKTFIIPIGKYYKILHDCHQRVAELTKADNDIKKKIDKEWLQFISQKGYSIDPESIPTLYRLLVDLSEFLVLNTLIAFTEKKASPIALFRTGSLAEPVYSPLIEEYTLDRELVELKENLFYKHLYSTVKTKIKVLKGYQFYRKAFTERKRTGAAFFEFSGKNNKIRFTISPFPFVVSPAARDLQILARYCELPAEKIIGIKIPFMLTLEFKGFGIVTKKTNERIAPWIENLVEYFQENLDWQYCAQQDLERMIVELMSGKTV